MTTFSLRRLIASAAAAITLAATIFSSAPAQATSYHNTKYLQVYSMSYADDARAKAWHLRKQGFKGATVFKSKNGLYAVVAGVIPAHRNDIVKDLKWKGAIPSDSFLTSGSSYIKEISLHGHKPHHKPAYKSSYGHSNGQSYHNTHKPSYKPSHKQPAYKHHNGKVVKYYY